MLDGLHFDYKSIKNKWRAIPEMRGKPAAFIMDYFTCWSVVFSDLLDNLIRAGRSQAAKGTADGW